MIALLRPLSSAYLLAVGFLFFSGCDDTSPEYCVEKVGECVLDTDCSDGQYCSCEEKCEMLDSTCGDGFADDACTVNTRSCRSELGVVCYGSDDVEVCEGVCGEIFGDDCTFDGECPDRHRCIRGYCLVGES